MKRARRCAWGEVAGAWWWIAWTLHYRAEGVASTEEAATAAIEHFLEADHRYTLAR